MMTDPIADMLTRIRNAVRVERATVELPSSKVKRGVADVLLDNFDDVGTVDDRRQPNDRTMERDVRRAMSVLSDDERVAVAACFFEDLTHEEAASALEIPLGTLKSQIARAKEKLRAPLAAYNDTTPGVRP